jgi:hypothetical protein
MKRTLFAALAVIASLAAGGCAHPISMQADTGTIVGAAKGAPKVDRKVALAITEEQKKREVTTPSGGGDKVSYFPYRDLETGLYLAMSETFTSVSKVSGVNDPKVKQDGITLVLVPEVTTTTHSPSLLTWPPTVVTIDLAATLKSADDRTLAQFTVKGEGRAEFDEFKADHSLSAKRAAQDVLKKLVKALGENTPKAVAALSAQPAMSAQAAKAAQ